MVRAFLVAAALAIAGIYAFANYARRSSMFFPDRFPIGMWDVSGLPIAPEDLEFESADGVRLHAWLFRATDPAAPLIVWLHGNAGNITNRAPMAAEFAKRSISVLLVEWRGFGKSEGRATENGLYRDAVAAYDFATKKLGFPADRIISYGESLGGPYAAYLAKERKVRAVVIENSFPSLSELGNALYSPVPVGWTARGAMATTQWLNRAGVPVLVMHGRRDNVIPYALGERLYARLTVPKEMLVSDSASHSEIPTAEPVRYYETVSRFIASGPR